MEWLKVILAGGLFPFILALVQAIRKLQAGSAARSERLQKSMERRVNEAEADSEWYVDLADYWRTWAGTVEYEARRHVCDPGHQGITLPDRPPLPVRQPLPSQEPRP